MPEGPRLSGLHLGKIGFWFALCLVSILACPAIKAQTTYTNLHYFTGYSSTSLYSDGLDTRGGVMLSGSTLYGVTEEGGTNDDGIVFAIGTNGTGFTVLHNFSGINEGDGANPDAKLILSGNTLYGTTGYGGSGNRGTVFSINTDGTGYTNLFSFTGTTNGDGPNGQLLLSGGMLYGTTGGGGISNDGTIFVISTNGMDYTNLYSFTGTNGGPSSGLVLSGNTLYGTTEFGGIGDGTIYAISTNGTAFTNLYLFSAINSERTNGDGANPCSELTLSGNTLYGAANEGGQYDCGTVFAINTDGTGFTNLISLSSYEAYPNSGLVLVGNTLYGTAYEGGNYSDGAVFAINTNGTGFAVPYSFSLTGVSDGALPYGQLISSGGVLYGAAYEGGTYDNGTLFAVNTNGTFTNLYSFPTIIDVTSSNGANPGTSLVLSGSILYGTTYEGGDFNGGTVFAMNINGTGYTNLYSFTGTNGVYPDGNLLLLNGTLYGTTVDGGNSSYGTVFAISTNGTGFTNLYSFMGEGDGSNPRAGLISSGGTLYGTTLYGGNNGDGAIFAIGTNGMGFTTLYSFTGGTNGNTPYDSLLLSGGILYGTTYFGGSQDEGNVFAISTNGTSYTNLYSFSGTNGYYPIAGLILLGNTLYGTTYIGGISNDGTVFAIGTNGLGFTNLYSFTGANGIHPFAGLISSGGTLYGTAEGGGHSADGMVFAINTNGTGFTNVYSFGAISGDGAVPAAALTLSGNTVYGTTADGGINGDGTAFSLYVGPYIGYTASVTNGAVPLTVQFSSPGADSGGNSISSWNWNFGDGSTSTAQNPTHTYTSVGNFFPSLLATNNLGWEIPGSGPAIITVQPANLNLLNNGGFEDGDFAYWNVNEFNNGSAEIVTSPVHSGRYAAEFVETYDSSDNGQSQSYLYQSLTTQPGANYLLSFWVDELENGGCVVFWNGSEVFDQFGYSGGWIYIQQAVKATGTTTQLEFIFPYIYSQSGYKCISALDDVSVIQLPSNYNQISSELLTNGNVSLSFAGIAGNYYALDHTFNLSPPVNWVPVVTNSAGSSGVLIFTNTPSPGTNNFWRIRSVP